MATHSSVLARRIPGMGEPVGLPSMGSHRVGHDWSDLAACSEVIYIYYFCMGEILSDDVLLCIPSHIILVWWSHVRSSESTTVDLHAACMLSHFSLVQLFATLWTVACQASLSLGFSRQEYQSGSHALLQRIFPTQRLNLHRWQILSCWATREAL